MMCKIFSQGRISNRLFGGNGQRLGVSRARRSWRFGLWNCKESFHSNSRPAIPATHTEHWGTSCLLPLSHLPKLSSWKSYPYLYQERRRRGENDTLIFLGDVYAYQGRFNDAAKLYRKAGQSNRAMNMYTDLRMFDFAKVRHTAHRVHEIWGFSNLVNRPSCQNNYFFTYQLPSVASFAKI